MSRNYYSEINLHLVWRTMTSAPLLADSVESLTHRALRKRIVDTAGAFVHAIGGTDDHVHLAVTVPPTLTVSEWIGALKGGSAHDVNQQAGKKQKVLQWQNGYGVVSFGKRDLPWVIDYIRNQRAHHATGTIHDRLERIEQLETDA